MVKFFSQVFMMENRDEVDEIIVMRELQSILLFFFLSNFQLASSFLVP
jgi:hypothetical protein